MIRSLITNLFWLFAAVMAATGFSPFFRGGAALSGYPLLAHVGLSPLFALLLFAWGLRILHPASNRITKGVSFLTFALIVLALLLMASSLINLFPLLRPEEQQETIELHRMAAVGFAVTAGLLAAVFAFSRFSHATQADRAPQ